MTIPVHRFTFILLIFLSIPLTSIAQTVDIPDANLRAVIEEALGKESGGTITTSDMAALTHLDARNSNISDLTGLEYAINLTSLHLSSNSISDISLLGRLTNLTWLYLRHNSISDISSLGGLTNLTLLSLSSNLISDITSLSGLGNLTSLGLSSNSISDISSLGGLTNLTELSLDRNSISDLSVVAGLTNLTRLSLWGNSISDISSLLGLTNLKLLSLSFNSISDILSLGGLTNLTWLDLNSNLISDISSLGSLTNLTSLSLDRNSISDLSALVTNTGLGSGDAVNVKFNPLSSVSIDTHIPVLQSRGVTVDFDDIIAGVEVEFPDSNLRAAIESVLGKTSGDPITTSDMALLTRLDARESNIINLTGLEHAINLTWLYLGGNSISDITSLSGLTNLTWLFLGYNSISDISALVINTGLGSGDTINVKGNPLSAVSIDTHIPVLQSKGVTVRFDDIVPGMEVEFPDSNLRAAIESALGKVSGDPITTSDMAALTQLEARNSNISDMTGLEHAINLTSLNLDSNSISDITSLAGLTNLTSLSLNSNSISDLSSLAGLTNLTSLSLWGNSISDISSLSGLTNLTSLSLNSNSISYISSLSRLTNLRSLNLDGNSISYIPSLLGLTSLTRLSLSSNSISDIPSLSGLTNLTWLNLWNNSISDISSLSGLTNLSSLNLSSNSISDITSLGELTNLTELSLWGNSISDLSALVTNTGLGSGDTINVRVNPLSSVSIDTHIPVLQSRGAAVRFDDIVAGVVELPDANLRAVIEEELGKTSGDPITTSDMAALTRLRLGARNSNISDLAGLEHAINLTRLYLGGTSISDISSLARLTKLTFLSISGTSVSDITSLSGLTSLRDLFLVNNSISDITPLSRLTDLTLLNLDGNLISDITSLLGLTNLTQLSLRRNSISDITSLSRLTNLTLLNLDRNSISDLSALAANTGLGNGDTVGVTVNPLSSVSIDTHIPALQSRGAKVRFDDIVPGVMVDISDANLRAAIAAELGKASGDLITTSDMASLARLSAINSNIVDLTGLEHAINLTSLSLWNTSISDISLLGGLTNLTQLSLWGNLISDITSLSELTNLTWLDLGNNSISDITSLSGLTNLTFLNLDRNAILDLSTLVTNTGLGNGDTVNVQVNPLSSVSIDTHIPVLQSRGVTVEFDDIVAGVVEFLDSNLRAAIGTALDKASGDPITTSDMVLLTRLDVSNSNISDLTGLEHAINLTSLDLAGASISDLSSLVGLTNLTSLNLGGTSISDLSSLVGLTNLTELNLWGTSISDLSSLVGLTNLTSLDLGNTSISDLSSLSGLTNLTSLSLSSNLISDITSLSGLTNLTWLSLRRNLISDITSLSGLTNLTLLNLDRNSISDLSALVTNTGLGDGDTVDVSANPLNSASINTHISALQSRGVEVRFSNLKPATPEYTLSIPAGIYLIHVPLKVTEVDGVAQTIESISDLYDVLGGASTVNFFITYDSSTQEWRSYFVPSDKGTPADRRLTDDMGIIAGLRAPVSVQLSGDPLGTDGSSTITLSQGLNLVGLPLRDPRISRVSHLFALDGIGGNVPVIILTDRGEFKAVGRAGDPGDIEITGGQSFILTAQRAVIVDISGDAWTNVSGTSAAPQVALTGIEVGNTTPVLGLRGSIADEGTGLKAEGFRVTVKNLSTSRAVAAVTTPDEAGYRSTVVDIETGRAATVGDLLEISAQSPNPFIGVESLQYTLTAEDVKQGWVQLPVLVAYEIPVETELLANYPNPFNPETWIPHRLAEDAFVTLTIYDRGGQVIRTLEVGHRIASAYENRSKAVYWDGRNEFGERVASGVYFYHLSAGDYSATRKMVILK